MTDRPQMVWRVTPGDLPSLYFDNRVEAELYQRDMTAEGYAVRITSFEIPETAKDFAAFMNR